MCSQFCCICGTRYSCENGHRRRSDRALAFMAVTLCLCSYFAGFHIHISIKVALNASEFGIPLAEQCRDICCTTPGCAFWTVTDPQPNSDEHICWLKKSDGAILPNGCQHYHSGHCWSGAVRGQYNSCFETGQLLRKWWSFVTWSLLPSGLRLGRAGWCRGRWNCV